MMLGKPIDLTKPEITVREDLESSVACSVRTIVTRDLGLGLRRAKFVKHTTRDQLNKHLTIVD